MARPLSVTLIRAVLVGAALLSIARTDDRGGGSGWFVRAQSDSELPSFSLNTVAQARNESYRPPHYVGTETARNLNRQGVRPSNVIVVPGEGNDSRYWGGLIIAPIVMIVCYFIWMCAICCYCCQSKQRGQDPPSLPHKNQDIGMLVFICLCLGSILAWILAIANNHHTEEGLNNIAQGMDETADLLTDAANVAKTLQEVTKLLRDLNQNISSTCYSEELVEFPINYSVDQIDQALEQVENALLTDLIVDLESTAEQARDVSDGTAVVLQARNAVAITLSTVMIILAIVLLVATCARYTQTSAPESYYARYYQHDSQTCMASFVDTCSKISLNSSFTCGITFLALIWFLIGTFYLLSVVLADYCIPSPDEALQRLLAQAEGTVPLDPSNSCVPYSPQDFDYDRFFKDPSQLKDPPELHYIICFYQACDGDNLFFDTLEVVEEYEVQIQVEILYLNSLITNISMETNLSETQQRAVNACASDVANVIDAIELTYNAFLSALELILCSTINPIYTKIVYEGVCKGGVDGSATLWGSFISGSVLLMVAMILYYTCDLSNSRKRAPELYEAKYTMRTGASTPADFGHSFTTGTPITSTNGTTNNNSITMI